MWTVTIDRGKCSDCGACLESCPGEVYARTPGGIAPVRQDECHGCHTCESVCPEEACFVEER
ncbi:MAG TPA: 4Fe-4S dicluster domain-containing protein [Desulfobacteraceae bacterium]|nr:4Fe-4S dicluster domain-containing protein [Desulfobacteraceae bacterium]